MQWFTLLYSTKLFINSIQCFKHGIHQARRNVSLTIS
ncbi:Uncharacterised protein [Vibrio cholerae]|nr:Uncharacterised protein [Vibrio cholerae]